MTMKIDPVPANILNQLSFYLEKQQEKPLALKKLTEMVND